ncbi:MAG TPA: hypothetical protein VHC22_26420 [Pirellulales bacterium]|nr:hypothetical protein [Pirellulales bacterium]
MIRIVLRTLVAILAGLLVSFLAIVAVEFVSNAVHPFPADFGGTTEEVCRHVERHPQWVLAAVVPAWALTAFVGTWTAGRIASLYSVAIVGLLLLMALLFNVSMLPYPIWFKIATPLLSLGAMVAGDRLSTRSKTTGINKAD